MSISTKDELEQVLEDIKSRLSVIETAQTKPKPKDETSSEEHEEPKESEEKPQVESEDEIEKLLNA